MKYALKRLAWADEATHEVMDEVLDVVLKVVPKPGTFVQKVILNDPYGNYIGHIKQKYLTLRPAFLIYHDKKYMGSLYKSRGLFRSSFRIKSKEGESYLIKGDIHDYEYKIKRGGKWVAVVSKNYFNWMNKYGIEISEGENAFLLVSAAIALDMLNLQKELDD